MRSRLFVAAVLAAMMLPAAAPAQVLPTGSRSVQEFLPAPGILNNSISNLHAEGDTVWVGPFLSVTTDRGRTWKVADADSLIGTQNRLYSIDVEGRTVWAGIGYTSQTAESNPPTAGGFVVSHDAGATFQYRFPPLDAPADSFVAYGASRLKALPVIVPEQSPPYDIDFDAATNTVWVAGWASGLRRSLDDGRTWERVVLPPDNLTEITPAGAYNFKLNPKGGTPGGNFNHTAFSVLVDETGAVWAGTPLGVNRSTDGGTAWTRKGYDGTAGGLTGSWVVSIEEQPQAGRNAIWMATWAAGETGERSQNGITVTRDGGETFEQVLLGERVIDFAFRRDTVFVAGRNRGLFITGDGGITWRTVRNFRDRNRPERFLRANTDVMAVAATRDALWVGTDDGLLLSRDGGQTWEIFRTDVPVHPATPTAEAPDVETYAYPNPFSPSSDSIVRIRFATSGGKQPVIRIYDFANALVRRIDVESFATGEVEVPWDGTDDRGLRVANGTYFYAVETGDDTVRGKILVLE